MNLLLPLNKALTLWPDREAVADGNERFTYRQFAARVASLVAALSGFDVAPGARVGILAPNCYKYMESYFGLGLSGLVLMPLNFRQSFQEVAAILVDSEASLLLVHSDFAETAVKAIQGNKKLQAIIWLDDCPPNTSIPCAQYWYDKLLAGCAGADLPKTAPDPSQLANLYYTSGTTGKPKGVMLSQGNVAFHALAAAYELSLTETDVWLHLAPMFHLADAWSVFSVTWCGGKHVFIPYFNAGKVLQLIERESVSLLAMVPTMANALLHDPALSKYSYASLRMFLTAGAPIAPELVRKIVESFGCQYVQYYGLTETSPLLTLSLLKAHHKHLSASEQVRIASRTGRSFLGVELRIVDETGCDVAANDEAVGEVIARGPGVTMGYWNQPDATAQLIREGWLHTGDLAVIDGEGYINVVDRKKDMIITGGENVYSTEVENVLYEHPSVLECAVFGLPNEEWGEIIMAVVVGKPGISLDEKILIDFVRHRLAHFKAPKSIDFVPELPKTGSGKIFKRGLRDRYTKHSAKQS